MGDTEGMVDPAVEARRSRPLLMVALAVVVAAGVVGLVALGGGDGEDAAGGSTPDPAPTTAVDPSDDSTGAPADADAANASDGADDGDRSVAAADGLVDDELLDDDLLDDELLDDELLDDELLDDELLDDDVAVPVTTVVLGGAIETTPPVPSSAGVHPLMDDYLTRTEVVFERALSERRLVVRAGDAPYGEFFDLEWELPTGSFGECLGGQALFVGDVTDGEPSGWSAFQTPRASGPVASTPLWLDGSGYYGNELFLVAAEQGDAVELRRGAVTLDRAELIDGLALLEQPIIDQADPLFEAVEANGLPVTTTIALLDGTEVIGGVAPWGAMWGDPSEVGDPCLPPQPPR
ncbi:MAG: hypothetical protein AAGG08_04170, partial [Actinomycetota bacterium]